MTETEIEAQSIENGSGGALVGSESGKELRRFGVTRDGHTIVSRQTIEQRVDGVAMAGFEKVDGWTGFHEEENLGRLVDGGEIRDGLFDAVVKNVKIASVQTLDKLAARIGDNDADIDAIDADVDGLGLRGSLLRCLRSSDGRRNGYDCKRQQERPKKKPCSALNQGNGAGQKSRKHFEWRD